MSLATEPVIFETDQNGNPCTLSTTSKLFQGRIVSLDAEITAGTCSTLREQLLVLEELDPEAPITMIVNSPGGDVYAGLGLISVMKSVSCPIRTVACGLVASMASLVLACGDERAAYSNSFILLHQPITGLSMAQQTDVDIVAKQTSLLRSVCEKLLSDRSGLCETTVHTMCERDCWLTTQEAREHGIIDEIIPNATKVGYLE